MQDFVKLMNDEEALAPKMKAEPESRLSRLISKHLRRTLER